VRDIVGIHDLMTDNATTLGRFGKMIGVVPSQAEEGDENDDQKAR